MKRRITCLFLILTILAQFAIIPTSVSAAPYLSDDSATQFLRFLYANKSYNPNANDIYYSLITGRGGDLATKQAFIQNVYKAVNENIYSHRLHSLKNHLLDDVPQTMLDASLEVVTEEVANAMMDNLDIQGADLLDAIDMIFKALLAHIFIRDLAQSRYFSSLLGQDQNSGYYEILTYLPSSDNAGLLSNDDKLMLDEWLRFMYELECDVLGGIEAEQGKTYTITFSSNCNDVSSQTYTYNTNDGNLDSPKMSREGYIFGGWYWDSGCTSSAAGTILIDRDMTFYAKWIDRYHTITFNYNCNDLADYVYTFDVVEKNWYEPTPPTRNGYLFDGWYWDKDCTNKVEGDFVVNKDLTFYAKWKQQYRYNISNGKATITRFLCYDVVDGQPVTDIEIPATIDGYPVVAIEYAFYYCSDLTSITIPNTVTSIGPHAFQGCTSLTSINIPDGVTTIGENAFYYCPDLASIAIPNTVTSIGLNAFSQCLSLSSITIPDNVTTIVGSPFGYCKNLQSINVSKGNTYYTSINGVLFNNNKTTLIQYPAGKPSINYDVPDGVITIGNGAFYGTELTSVTVPNSVTDIESSAFSSCTKLTSIAIPNSVTSIGVEAFWNCPSLTSVTLSNSVTTIDTRAFMYCKNLTNINIPASVTTIGEDAFMNCYNLTSVTIPDSITTIKNGAFAWCKKLTSINIPEGVTTIGVHVFLNCYNLASITIPDSITTISERAFNGCINLQTTYYYGTPQQWNNVTIGAYNEALTGTVIFVKHTKTDVSEDGKAFAVNPVNIEEGVTVIVALYNGDKFVEMQSAIYESEELTFTTTCLYDTVKIMVWGDLNDLQPVTEPEII